jgi:hypothetical protein
MYPMTVSLCEQQPRSISLTIQGLKFTWPTTVLSYHLTFYFKWWQILRHKGGKKSGSDYDFRIDLYLFVIDLLRTNTRFPLCSKHSRDFPSPTEQNPMSSQYSTKLCQQMWGVCDLPRFLSYSSLSLLPSFPLAQSHW